MENNLQKYKQELISDLIINGVSSSIELEKRLDRMIEIAQQPEPAVEFLAKRLNPNTDYKELSKAIAEVAGEIKPEDMVKGEWYSYWFGTEKDIYCIFKFDYLKGCNTFCQLAVSIHKGNILIKGENELLSDCAYNYTYSKATREEVTKYFPHEFEIDAHGGNDAGHVCPITN